MQSFRYDFTPKEFFYFLFKKKKCPKCGGKMKKEKRFEIVDGSKFNTNSVPLYIQGREVKYYSYFFTCTCCEAKFKLSELAEKKKERRI